MFENLKNKNRDRFRDDVPKNVSAKKIREQYEETYEELNKVISSLQEGVSPTIITPSTTSAEITALPNAVYRVQGKGTYNLLVAEAVEGVTIDSHKTVVDEGYDVKFVKTDEGWEVASSVKMPTLSVDGKVEEGNTDAVSGGEVFESQELLQTKSDFTLKTKSKTVASALNEVYSQTSVDPIYGLDQSKRHLFDGKILAMWGDVLPSFPIYVSILQNVTTGLGIAIYINRGGTDYISSFRDLGATSPRTGIEDIYLSQTGGSGLGFHMKVNWDNISTNSLAGNHVEVFSLPKEEIVNEDNKTILDVVLEHDEVIKEIPALSNLLNDVDALSNQVEDLSGLIRVPIDGIIGGDTTMIDNGVIKDIYISTNERVENIYLSRILNSPTQRMLIQFLGGDTGSATESPVVYQFYPTEIYLRTGVQTHEMRRVVDVGLRPMLYITIDWDVLGAITYNKDGGRLSLDTGLLNTQPTLPFLERIDDLDQRVEILENQETPGYLQNELYFNVFGDVLPPTFKSKMLSYEKDLEVVCVGNSITGLISGGGAFPQAVASQLPPGCTHDYWTYMLWDRICKNKPLSDRLDSVREGEDFFTKTGSWEQIVDGKFNEPADIPAGEHSYSSLTYQSANVDAAISFLLDTDKYKKAAIVTSINPDGADAVVSVSQGNGKLLASINKTDWVEANGFEFTARSNDGLTNPQARSAGVALHQRHRRIWLKAAESVSETLTVTFQRNDLDPARFLYCWGIDRWNGNSIFVTNLGRGGRRTHMLYDNITDVSDRNPDLVLYEMPIANEFKNETLVALKTSYTNYFLNTGSAKSLASKSNSYTDMQCIVILPHNRGTCWDGDQAVMGEEYLTEYLPYFKSKMLINWLKETSTFEDGITYVNLQDQLINEAKFRGMTIEQSLTGSMGHDNRFVTDTIHLNLLGSKMYAKYLSPIFNEI